MQESPRSPAAKELVGAGGRSPVDNDLFQYLALGLLLLSLIVTLVVLNTLNTISRAVTELTSGAGEQSARRSQSATTGGGESAGIGYGEAVRAYDTAGYADQGPAGYGYAGATPADMGGAATGAAQAAAAAATGAAQEEEPEEQPFERDGRWYFRRGDELLLYNEQIGQWQPAPGQVGGEGAGAPSPFGDLSGAPEQGAAAAAAGAGAADDSPASYVSDVTATGVTQSPSAETFWKCPSCGAVNGATADSCRMCFSPRPR